MMGRFIGEILGTFVLLIIGLGFPLTLYSKSGLLSKYYIGLIWFLAVFVGNMASLIFGTANLNPVFSVITFFNHSISGEEIFTQILAQVIGATGASLLLLLLKKKINVLSDNQRLSYFSTVPNDRRDLKNFIFEFFGTGLIVLISQFMLNIKIVVPLSTLIISAWIGILIVVVSPITGAAFNPVRDIIPRFIFSKSEKNFSLGMWDYAWIPCVAPLFGGIFFYFISKYVF